MIALPRIVAIHGLKRAGKGTVAAHLVAAHGYTNVKLSGALKDMTRILLARVCGLDAASAERCIESDLKEVPIPSLGGKSGRYVMQTIGTEYRDALDPRMWTRIALEDIRRLVASGGRAAVDDLRFPHEVELFRPEGAALWLVTSDRGHDEPIGLVLPWDPHAAATLAIGDDVLDEMLACLLAHCGLTPVDVAQSLGGCLRDMPIPILGGRSACHCAAMLRTVWLPLMAAPMSVTPVATAGHVSEKGLSRDIFGVHLRNDGSFDDLHRQVDAALLDVALAA